jgi:hypothetical protein
MNKEMKSSLTAVDTWTRGLFMLLFVVIYSVAEFVLGAVVFFQFLHVLATRETNERLREFTTDVSVFMYQILQFLTFNSEVKPYPFASWPDGPADLESLDMLDNIQGTDATDTVIETESEANNETETKSEAEVKPDDSPDETSLAADKSKSDKAD